MRSTAPGDLVEVAITDRRRLLEGRLLRIVEPGPARVATRCLHVDECGACQWQQVSIEAQREAKRSNLIEALVRIARVPRESLPEVGLVASPEDFRYRRRARFMVGMQTGQLGYAGSDGRPPVALRECHLLAEPIETLVLGLSALLERNRPRPHHVEICVVNGKASVLLEYDEVWDQPEGLQAHFVNLMFRRFPFLAGVVVRPRPRGVHLGDPDLFDGTTFLASGRLQPSESGSERTKLVQAALQALNPEPGNRALELFCGNGNFTLPLARRALEVVAIEESSIALRLLQRALDQAWLWATRARCPGRRGSTDGSWHGRERRALRPCVA